MTSAKIRVLIDGLKPITKEAILGVGEGIELPVYLEYENLEQHCSNCNSLCHLERVCPQKAFDTTEVSSNAVRELDHSRHSDYSYRTLSRRTPSHSANPTMANPINRATLQFSQRLDRYRRPFGERLPLPTSRAQGLKNKITPHQETPRREQRNQWHSSEQNYNPPIQHPRARSQREDLQQNTSHTGQPSNLQWRERQQVTAPHQNTELLPRGSPPRPRPPLEGNLEVTEFPPLPQAPTTEEVLEELREVTYQYTNVQDPVENAARMQRLLDSEVNGLMAETAANIVAAATRNFDDLAREPSPPVEHEAYAQDITNISHQVEFPDSSRARQNRVKKAQGKRIASSPRTLLGAKSLKRNLYPRHSSPASHGIPHASPIQHTQSRARRTSSRSNAPRPNSSNTSPQGNPQDFHSDQLQLP